MMLVAMLSLLDASQIKLLSDQMTLPHVAVPSGAGNYDWGKKPRIGYGNNPGTWSAFITWGQIYVPTGETPPKDSRAEISAAQAYILSKKTGKWTCVQFSNDIGGAAYREDFVNDESKPADIQKSKEGNISIRLEKSYNFHFWPNSGRVPIDPTDIGGVVTAFRVRQIAQPGEKWVAKGKQLMMSAGADYWEKPDSQWDQWKTNGDVAIGRFEWITPKWQWYTMTTLTEAELTKNPPPAFRTK